MPRSLIVIAIGMVLMPFRGFFVGVSRVWIFHAFGRYNLADPTRRRASGFRGFARNSGFGCGEWYIAGFAGGGCCWRYIRRTNGLSAGRAVYACRRDVELLA
jgi:hypothetical protein